MPHLPLSEGAISNSIDVKANGAASRMRSHKGNMPSLPQTKYCALCPAKFTRTTHLNRHLRSHTNERAHRCNICKAEFTRSDLLTRHKRTCGDSVNRSRRKSCQACAESKVKCNLQRPCSKCASRGKECVFINDPEASRNRKKASKSSPRSSLSLSPGEADFSESSAGFDSLGPSSPTSSLSFSSHRGPDNFSHLVSCSQLTTQLLPAIGFGLPGVSNVSDCSSSACSSRSSPRLDYFDARHDYPNSLRMPGLDTLEHDSELNDFFPGASDMLMDEHLQTEVDLAAWFDSNLFSFAYGNGEPSLYSQFQQHQSTDQDFVTGLTNLTPASSSKAPFSREHFSPISPAGQSASAFGASSGSENPTAEDLNTYLCLFLTEFNTQIPLFHRPTFKMEVTHPVLLRAMQACGALFAKNQIAMKCVIETLTSSRDTLIMEFLTPSRTLKERMCLMLATVLLQSIGFLNPRPDLRALSRVYHEILVMMVRKTNLIKVVGSWPPPDLSNLQSLENDWRDWARLETFKRALILAYLQDCSYSVYYSAPPAFLPAELDINLPCDDTLWRSQSAAEWYQIQRIASPYGISPTRIRGTNMQIALTSLKEPTPSVTSFTVNPFASFVLIHSILRDVFSIPGPMNPGTNHPGIPIASSSIIHPEIPPSINPGVMIECALHNWQRMWSSSPEAVQSEKQSQQGQRVPFVHSALPFYWLARFAEAAKQNGTMQVSPLSSRGDVEDRYRTVKGWLEQIKATLHSGSQVSPSLWNNPASVVLPPFSHAPP